jgi:hypothetical protein
MDNHRPQSFRWLRAPAVIVLVTFFSSLSIRGENLAAPAIYDPVRTFNDPDGFAAVQFGIPVRADTVLRGGPTVQPSPICAWITGDYGEDKGRNYLEAGISTEFVLRKNSRYPLIVTIPVSTALGDEEYFFGPHFAHISTGVNVRVPLSFIPSRYGKWTAASITDVCYFGTSAAQVVHSVGLRLPNIAAAFSVEF